MACNWSVCSIFYCLLAWWWYCFALSNTAAAACQLNYLATPYKRDSSSTFFTLQICNSMKLFISLSSVSSFLCACVRMLVCCIEYYQPENTFYFNVEHERSTLSHAFIILYSYWKQYTYTNGPSRIRMFLYIFIVIVLAESAAVDSHLHKQMNSILFILCVSSAQWNVKR